MTRRFRYPLVALSQSGIAPNENFLNMGDLDCGRNPDYPAADNGDVYFISVGGKIGGASGILVAPHNVIICKANDTPSGDQATVGGSWNILSSSASVAILLSERVVAPNTAALGTNSATAAPLPDSGFGVYPVTGSDNFNGVRIHANDAVLQHKIMIVNLVPNKSMHVYPPTGGNINGLGVDVGYPTASGGSATLICTDAVTNTRLAFD